MSLAPYFFRPRTHTTSSYIRFSASDSESDSEEEREQVRKEERKLERKRRRLAVRGDTPDEPLPPPATPRELSEALRRVKPTLIQGLLSLYLEVVDSQPRDRVKANLE